VILCIDELSPRITIYEMRNNERETRSNLMILSGRIYKRGAAAAAFFRLIYDHDGLMGDEINQSRSDMASV
jgi:hypothetical protein